MPPTSLLPKIFAAVFFLAGLYQLSAYISIPELPQRDPFPPTDKPKSTWFSDAIKAPPLATPEDDEEAPPDAIPHVQTIPSSPSIPLHNYTRIHIPHGPTQCMPHFSSTWRAAAQSRNTSCSTSAPFSVHETHRVAFASITTGAAIPAYQRAILSQMFHAAVHDSSIHIMCDALTDGMFNKIAFLLHLVMTEMLKPAESRLEWIMWIDRDVIVLDACRPLSAFLPPRDDEAFDKIQLVINHDSSGLNAGVFIFRVSEWTMQYLNRVLAFRYFRPDVELAFAEQTAMDIVMKEEEEEEGGKDRVVQVPWYWFNAYPDGGDSVRGYKENSVREGLEWFRARRGDFAVHFAGDEGRVERMMEWEDVIEEVGNVWVGETRRDISREVEEYWKSWKEGSLTVKQREGGDDAEGEDEEKRGNDKKGEMREVKR
ncbi:hypothetical protein NX059_004225 [Plenodomus lindquistii]|nr:hypothetical protein NX059_004225 [Plenodomus lindquistii]